MTKPNDYTTAAIYRLLRLKKIDFAKSERLLVDRARLTGQSAHNLVRLWRTSQPIREAYSRLSA